MLYSAFLAYAQLCASKVVLAFAQLCKVAYARVKAPKFAWSFLVTIPTPRVATHVLIQVRPRARNVEHLVMHGNTRMVVQPSAQQVGTGALVSQNDERLRGGMPGTQLEAVEECPQ